MSNNERVKLVYLGTWKAGDKAPECFVHPKLLDSGNTNIVDAEYSDVSDDCIDNRYDGFNGPVIEMDENTTQQFLEHLLGIKAELLRSLECDGDRCTCQISDEYYHFGQVNSIINNIDSLVNGYKSVLAMEAE